MTTILHYVVVRERFDDRSEFIFYFFYQRCWALTAAPPCELSHVVWHPSRHDERLSCSPFHFLQNTDWVRGVPHLPFGGRRRTLTTPWCRRWACPGCSAASNAPKTRPGWPGAPSPATTCLGGKRRGGAWPGARDRLKHNVLLCLINAANARLTSPRYMHRGPYT